MTNAENEREEVTEDADNVPLVSLATDDHVVLQDVDLCPSLNLCLGVNLVRLVTFFCEFGTIWFTTCFQKRVTCIPSSMILLRIAQNKYN